MKQLRRAVRFLDRLEDYVILVCCAAVFLIGVYSLYDNYLIYQEANDTSLLKYKPSQEDGGRAKDAPDQMTAWLTLDGTSVDYPVMQGKTNMEYLTKNPYGEYSLSGSIFLDCRNSPDFSDEYSLIYGHHMEGGMMFGALDDFLDRDYFDAHRSGELFVDDQSLRIHIFAVMEADASDEKLFAPTEADAADTLEYIKKHALFFEEQTVLEIQGSILALSTCKYPDTADRVLVFGILEGSGSERALDE